MFRIGNRIINTTLIIALCGGMIACASSPRVATSTPDDVRADAAQGHECPNLSEVDKQEEEVVETKEEPEEVVLSPKLYSEGGAWVAKVKFSSFDDALGLTGSGFGLSELMAFEYMTMFTWLQEEHPMDDPTLPPSLVCPDDYHPERSISVGWGVIFGNLSLSAAWQGLECHQGEEVVFRFYIPGPEEYLNSLVLAMAGNPPVGSTHADISQQGGRVCMKVEGQTQCYSMERVRQVPQSRPF